MEPSNESESASLFYDHLVRELGSKHFIDEPISIDREYSVTAALQKKIFDFCIKTDERIICLIEFVRDQETLFDNSLYWVASDSFYFTYTRFLARTDGATFIVRDRFKDQEINDIREFNEFISLILRPLEQTRIEAIREEAGAIISSLVQKYYPDSEVLRKHLLGIGRNLKLSRRNELFFEGSKSDDQSFENRLFLLLMNDGQSLVRIYRYTSLKRAFEMIETESIRMSGLPGMNDITEPNYVDNYLKNSDLHLSEEMPQTIAAVNRRFILCCTELKDELIQWRLYGDDNKGACIEFRFDNENYNQRTNGSVREFFIGKVRYADKKQRHKELDLILEIQQEVWKRFKLKIRFTMLYVWKHFFKPHEYSHEKEVRLLFLENVKSRKKWLVTNSHGIINPYVEFSLKSERFPLQVSQIILGNKAHEVELNRVQLNQFLSERGLKVKVEKSSIRSYR